MKKVNFTLTEPLIKKLVKIKEETGMTASEIVRRALDEWFINQERTKRDSFR